MPGLLAASIRTNACRDNSILPQYRTNSSQIDSQLCAMRASEGNDWFPIHWEIDVADEWNGWFRGVAVAYHDASTQLQVCVPDPAHPIYQGKIPLDYRVVRLRDCMDMSSVALFNEIVRRSEVKITWEVDWFDAAPAVNPCKPSSRPRHPLARTSSSCSSYSSNSTSASSSSHSTPSMTSTASSRRDIWKIAIARYYFPILNTILIEDSSTNNRDLAVQEEEPSCTSSSPSIKPRYMVLVINKNLRLRECLDGRGLKEMEYLVFDEGVRCLEEAKQQIKSFDQKCYKCDHQARETPPNAPHKHKSASPRRPRDRGKTAQQPSNCVICLSNPVANIAFVPCGHQALCTTCIPDSMRRREHFVCPICRAVVRQQLTIYSV